MGTSRPRGPRRLDTLVQQSSVPAFILSVDNKILYVNPAWERFTGLQSTEVVGNHLGTLIPDRSDSQPTTESRSEWDWTSRLIPPPEVAEGRVLAISLPGRAEPGRNVLDEVIFWPNYREGEDDLFFILGLVRRGAPSRIVPTSESSRLRTELWRIQEESRERFGGEALIGSGPAHQRNLAQLEAASAINLPIMLVGEPGTGKRHFGRIIGRRRDASDAADLIEIDCRALPPRELALEFFRVSARGEPEAEQGLAVRPNQTLLLLELTGISMDLQLQLARVIAGSGIRPQIIATSTIDPSEARRRGQLRDDLYYQLTGFVIQLAPLRDRLEELPIFAQHFLERENRRTGEPRFGFETEALDVMNRYDWPGNLQELSTVVAQAHRTSDGPLLGVNSLPRALFDKTGATYLPPRVLEMESFSLDESLERLERKLLERAIVESKGNKSLAAKLLHISRARLHRRLQELGLDEDSTETLRGSN